jgi:hypothetical protein
VLIAQRPNLRIDEPSLVSSSFCWADIANPTDLACLRDRKSLRNDESSIVDGFSETIRQCLPLKARLAGEGQPLVRHHSTPGGDWEAAGLVDGRSNFRRLNNRDRVLFRQPPCKPRYFFQRMVGYSDQGTDCRL